MSDTDQSDLEVDPRGHPRAGRKFDHEYWRDKDNKHEVPLGIRQGLRRGGWLGAMIPEEYGGIGLGLKEAAVMLGEISASGAGMSGASAIHFYVFPPAPIVRHGSEEMKQRVPAEARRVARC